MKPQMLLTLAGSAKHSTPMQRAIFGYLPEETSFYLDVISINGKGQYIYVLNGSSVVMELADNFSGSIYVPNADAGSKLVVMGEAITKISQDEQQTLTSLDVSGLTALTNLNCSYNELASLDVSGLTALTNLSCSNNPLISLDVSGLTALTNLHCESNELIFLDVSGLTALTGLHCESNELRSLDVSGLTALTNLNCSDNRLTSLDVSGLTALTTLYCSNNPLIMEVRFNATAQSPATNVAGLITAADSTAGTVYLNSSDTYYSTVADAATAKGWTIEAL